MGQRYMKKKVNIYSVSKSIWTFEVCWWDCIREMWNSVCWSSDTDGSSYEYFSHSHIHISSSSLTWNKDI